MVKVLIFGDSIAWGAFDVDKGGWVERLKTDYLATYNTQEVGIYNLAISGNDSRGVLFSLEKEVEIFNAVEPEKYIFLFSIGSNDPRYIGQKNNPFIPFDEFNHNLEKIVAISKKHASTLIFTGLMIVNEKLTKPWKEDIYPMDFTQKLKDTKKYILG
jgi:lysophospholipase L1-like esterase